MFSVRVGWAARVDAGEEFDARGFCVGDVVGDGITRIVTGSLGGVLRIFRPSLQEYSLDDLELEEQLDEPVLQLSCGRFAGTEGVLSLAVLHPQKLAVYGVAAARDGGGALALEPRYVHTLCDGDDQRFSAANMVFGPFGSVRGRDFIAVQSLDGKLRVFEQESAAFSRQLNHVLLPGPMAYLRKQDAMLVCNSQFQVDCYKYSLLAASTSRAGASGLLATDWTFTVGEQVLELCTTRLSQGVAASQVDIFILAERSLYCLNERGVVRTHVRLDVGCNPMCFATLPILKPAPEGGEPCESPDSTRNLLVVSETGKFSVFRHFRPVWSASLTKHLPVAIAACRVQGVDGVMVSMSDDGRVLASFMGTDASTNPLVPKRTKALAAAKAQASRARNGDAVPESKHSSGKENQEALANVVDELRRAEDFEYEAMDREHRRLLEKIRTLHKRQQNEQASAFGGGGGIGSDLLVRAQSPAALDNLSVADAAAARSDPAAGSFAFRNDGQPVQATVKVYLSHRRPGPLHDVRVTLKLPEPFVCSESCVAVEEVPGTGRTAAPPTPLILQLPVRVRSDALPTSLDATVICIYKTGRGAIRTSETNFRLPFFLAARVRPAIKNSVSKITLETEGDAARLSVVFDEMLRQPGVPAEIAEAVSGATSNVVSFEFFNGANVTVLASKSGGRYRVQGRLHGHLCLAAEELQRRLAARSEPAEVSFADPLPLDGLFQVIDGHHQARLEVARASSTLNDRAYQYRLVQKRLLARFKDKNAPPLKGLDALLSMTHEQIMAASDSLASAQKKVFETGCDLAASVRLLNFLATLKYPRLTAEDQRVLAAHFSPNVLECTGLEMGWEELTDAAVTHLLRTSLAKAPKATAPASGAGSTKPTLAADPAKLKKHISILFDRLAKGAHPAIRQPDDFDAVEMGSMAPLATETKS